MHLCVEFREYRAQQNFALPLPAIHCLLQSNVDGCSILQAKLEQISGLSLEQLRQLYGNCLVASLLESKADDPLSRVLRYDPHKAIVQVKNDRSRSGSVVEVISGR